MPDIPLGGAYVDVSLRFAEFEKGLKEADRRARKAAKQIEESFMVKYAKGFVEKETLRAQENAIKNAAVAAKEEEARLIATKARIAAEIVAEEELEKVESERLRIMLGINESLDDQIRKAVALTKAEQQMNQMMSGIRAVPMAGSPGAFGRGGRGGGNVGTGANQAGQNMAQLSYAIQDFATGLAMGNFNMAVMGASNNLGMMAQSIGPVAGGLTVIAAALLPHAVDAIEKFEGSVIRAAKGVQFLKRAYEEFKDSLSRKASLAEATFKIGDMESTPAATDRLKDLKNQQKIEGDLSADRAAERKRIKDEIKGSEVRLTGIAGMLLNPEAKPGVTKTITMEQREQLLKQIKDIDDADKKAGKDRSDRAKEIQEIESKIAELKTRSGIALRAEMDLHTGSTLDADIQKAMDNRERRLKKIEEEAPEWQKAGLKKTANEIHKREVDEAKVRDKLAKNRLELEMKPFSTPAQHARLRAEEDYQRNLSEIQKRPIEEREALETQAKDKLAADLKKADDEEAKSKRDMQANLTAGVSKDAAEKLRIQNKLQDRIEEINKMGGLTDAEREQMRQMAGAGAMKELANLGPKTSFSGIADLSKQIQLSMEGDPTALYTKEMKDAIKDKMDVKTSDVVTAIKNITMGFGP